MLKKIASVRRNKIISCNLKKKNSNSIILIMLDLQMPEFSAIIKMKTLISTFHFRLRNYTSSCLIYWSFREDFLPYETYYIENIKSRNFILGTYTKSTNTNIQIHELVSFSQTTKTDTHEETYLIHWLLLYRILINIESL